MKNTISCILALISFSAFAQNHFVRFNNAGYKTNGIKSLIINADESLYSRVWSISINDSIVLKGQIKKSITGKGDHTNFPFNYKVDFSSIKFVGEVAFKFENNFYPIIINHNPYFKYTKEILRYLRQQRSASFESVDRSPGHFNDSSAILYRQIDNKMLWEESSKKVDVIGGWYDAGDYIKFTLTNAYTTYLLLRAYEENPIAFSFKHLSKSSLVDILDEARFGLDYLEKCYVNDSTFIIQVADNNDHKLGDRLPKHDTNKKRFAYNSMSRTHLAYTSAAFATAARVFAKIDSISSKRYLKKAEELFALSEKHKGVYWFQKNHEIFYADKTPYDNIILAASELIRSTSKKVYIDKIKYYSSMAGRAYWASWSDFNMIAHARAGEFYFRSKNYLIADLEGFEKKALNENNIWNIPHDYTWGSLYSFFGVASSAILHDELLKEYRFSYLAQDVIDYTFGKNNWGVSFVATKKLTNSVKNVYSQTYKLQPQLFPIGAIAEGPGDLEGHLENVKWFSISKEAYKSGRFNTNKVVFYDDATDFQTMETTICGLADGIFLLSLVSK